MRTSSSWEMRHSHAPPQLAGTFLAFFLIASLVFAAEGEQPRFKVTTKKQDDSVEVRAEKDKALFVVKSPSGISQAVIEPQDGNWPQDVVLRLHLMGLESFRLYNGKVTLDAAVSVQEGRPKCGCGRMARKTFPWTREAPSGPTFASSVVTASQPGSFR
jgi:hypothetical protein